MVRKLTAGLLVFLFLISPLASLQAAEPEAPVEEQPVEEVQNTEAQTEESAEGTEESEETNNSQEMQTEDPKLEPEKAPKRQLAQPDEATGALIYDYPLSIPAGRNGLQPDLRLTYNSQSVDKESFVGQGWNIPIPFIERVNKKGTNTMYTDNFFNSYADGELVNIEGTSYGAKVENGSFTKYTFSNNVWTAVDKQGTIYTYGLNAASRQDDPNDSSRIYKWMLTEIKDTNGNLITYFYNKETAQIYPDYINYGHTSTAAILFSVTFTRETRSDVTLLYKTGFAVTTSKRLKEITTRDYTTNQWFKKYTLNYTTGDNTKTSILSSITESGQDESNNVVTLPAEQFEYQLTNPATAHWSEDMTYTAPLDIRTDMSVMVIDVNGDGYEDILRSHQSGQQAEKFAFISNGNKGWVLDSNYEPELIFGVSTGGQVTDNGVRMIDVNGDGRVDMVQNNGGELNAYLNTGSGWQQSSTWNPPQRLVSNVGSNPPYYFANINGDGLPDLINALEHNNAATVYINDGSGWNADTTTWTSPRKIDYSSGSMLVDVNGDGLDDILESVSNNGNLFRKAYLNTGEGTWNENAGYEPPVNFVAKISGPDIDYGVRFVDVNGDGLVDILQGSNGYGVGRSAYVNTGTSWQLNTKWSPMMGFSTNNYSNNPAGNVLSIGQSLPDTLLTQGSGSERVTTAFTNNEKKVNLLKKITLATGGTIEATYTSTPMYKSGSTLLNPGLQVTLDTVSQIKENDGNGVISMTDYSYEGGYYYYNNPLDYRFAGFSKITKTDDLSKVVSYYHQGNGSNSGQGEYDDHVSKIGRKYREEVFDLSGNRFSKTINKWDRHGLDGGGSFVKLVQTVESVFDGNSSHKDRAMSYDYDDDTGNQTAVIEWGEVDGSDTGTFTDTGLDKFSTAITYATGTSGVSGLPATELRADQSLNKVTETKHYYDNLSFGQVDKGNETKTEMWRGGSKYIDVEKTYNSYGLVTSEKDPRDKQTSYTYDSYNLYPATVTNPLNQVTLYEYDYSLGKPKRTIDQNNRSFYTDYDGLDRVIAERQPDPANPTTSVTAKAYVYTNTANAVSVKESSYLSSSNVVDAYTYFDGLGRKIQERQESDASNIFNVRDFVYDDNGQLLKESLPYSSTGYVKTSPTTTSTLYTTYSYDAMQRVISAATAVGSTVNAYDDWKTTVTDPEGKIKDIYRDAHDNLVRVDEHNGSSIYTTTYEWSGLKKLKKITDALGNIRNFSYDGLGRVLSAEDLHAPADTTFGVWTYAYDDASNLSSRLDPNGVTTSFTYDDINRVLSEDGNNDQQVEVTYSYDTCTEGVGRLCTVVSAVLETSYVYNALGQVLSESKAIDKVNYETQFSYDRQGNQTLITNPDGSEIKFVYDSGGLINEIERKESTGSFVNVISNIDYNPVNLPTIIGYGNGVTTTNTYDASELYRLRTKVTVADSQNVQDLTYTYDAVGNIMQIVDASATITAKTIDYTYDDLHRLLSSTITNAAANGPGNETQTFTYDAIGNILTKSDVGSYSYEGDQGSSYANPHAVTSAGGTTYTYDNNGNVTSAGFLTSYTWDYNNRLIQASNGLMPFSYSYDATGQRVKSIESSGTSIYVTKEYTVTPTGVEKHIFFGDTALATVSGTNEAAIPYSIHADHLTGSNVITDEGENIDELTDYQAFGTMRVDQQNSRHTEKRKHTGHELDRDTGLTYANARYYNAALGRWMSQDPLFQNIFSTMDIVSSTGMPLVDKLVKPQTLNAYSYVVNNPMRYIDPTGEDLRDFAQGFANALGSNMSFGLGRQSSSNSDFQSGQRTGDVVSMITGTIEMAVGAAGAVGGAAGGIITSPTGVGAVAGAAVSVEGIAITAHGYGTAAAGAYNFSKANSGNKSIKTPGQINQEKYLRVGKDKGYIDYIKNIYRKEADIGSGSTADYYRTYHDLGHKIKLEARIKQGQRLISNGRLTPEEVINVKNINKDMLKALSGQ